MTHTASSAEKHGHHVIPTKILLRVFLTLVALTVITVAAAMVDLGFLNVPVALGIAAVKAALVVMIFMALKYDTPTNVLVFAVGSIFVVIFLTFTLFDTAFRGDLGNVDPFTIQDRQRLEQQAREAHPELFGGAAADTPMTADSTAAAAADTSAAAQPAP